MRRMDIVVDLPHNRGWSPETNTIQIYERETPCKGGGTQMGPRVRHNPVCCNSTGETHSGLRSSVAFFSLSHCIRHETLIRALLSQQVYTFYYLSSFPTFPKHFPPDGKSLLPLKHTINMELSHLPSLISYFPPSSFYSFFLYNVVVVVVVFSSG